MHWGILIVLVESRFPKTGRLRSIRQEYLCEGCLFSAMNSQEKIPLKSQCIEASVFFGQSLQLCQELLVLPTMSCSPVPDGNGVKQRSVLLAMLLCSQ